jgi:hypothetical protein
MQFERLEYGKRCQWDDGPIIPGRDGNDYACLGRSPGFPKELGEACGPERHWFAEGGLDEFAPGCAHASVWRPLRTPEGSYRHVLCMVRIREEDGPGTRPYALGRFVLAPEVSVGPDAILRAAYSVPLIGLSIAHLERGLSPLETEGGHEGLELPPWWETFTTPAIEYLLSGIPIQIGTLVAESCFYALLAALWKTAPGELKPLISAGWGVGESLTGKLHVAYGRATNDRAAIFMPEQKRWIAPLRASSFVPGSDDVVPFEDKWLEPARLYIKRQTTAAQKNRETEPAEAWAVQLAPYLPMPSVMDWQVVELFRQHGRCTSDHVSIRRLAAWLRDGGEFPPAVVEDGFFLPAYWDDGVRMAIAASGSAAERRRSDRFLLAALKSGREPAKHAISSAEGPGSERARMLLAVLCDSSQAVLASLEKALAAKECHDLPDAILPAVHRALEHAVETVDDLSLSFHQEALTGEMAEWYRDWLPKNAPRLAVALVCSRSTRRTQVLESLAKASPNPVVEACARWVAGHSPTKVDLNTISRLPDALRLPFCQQVRDAWASRTGAVAQRRERALPWAGALIGPQEEDVLLGLIMRGPTAFEREDRASAARELCQEVKFGRVPPSAERALAETALRYWNDFHLVDKREEWKRILRYWPITASLCLLGQEPAGNENPRIDSVVADGLQLQQSVIENAAASWLADSRVTDGDLKQVASLFCRWIEHVIPQPELPPGIVETATTLVQADFATIRKPGEQTLEKSWRLLKAAGLERRVEKRLTTLWRSAMDGLHLLFLLKAFPDSDENPTVDQLAALIPYRRQLRDLLGKGAITGSKRGPLAVAAGEFHSLPYKRGMERHWTEKDRKTPLWAVYRGTPTELQGKLWEALSAYADNRDARIGLCHKYLDQSANRMDAAEQVLWGFLLPMIAGVVREREAMTVAEQLKHGKRLLSRWAFRVDAQLADTAVIERKGVLWLAGWYVDLFREATVIMQLPRVCDVIASYYYSLNGERR